MNPTDSDAPSVRHPERKATALILLTLLLIGGFVVYVMAARGVFEQTQRLVLVADNSEGVTVGMDMTFSGFPIGRVRRIELAENGKVHILIDVPHEDAHWLRTSSVFTMERSLVGETRIRAFSGVLDDPPLPDGAWRPVLSGDAMDALPQVMASMRDLLKHLEAMTAEDSPLNASLSNLQTVTGRMTGRHGALTGLFGNEADAARVVATLERTNRLLADADRRLFGRDGMADQSQQAIGEMRALLGEARDSLKKVDAALADVQAVAANARAGTADLGQLRAEVEASLRKAGSLIDEINRKWPFARDTGVELP